MTRPDLGPWSLDAPLARGGMGEVWSAVHTPSGTPVAVKLLTDARERSATWRASLRREIRAAAALDHPGVVPVFDQGELPGGAPFLVMARATGTLADAPPASWEAARARVSEVLQALAHAHARGVVHRDLKPGNLLVSPSGAVWLADFGIAHLGREDLAAVASGTPGYMAPEQLTGAAREQGPWTDLYALAVLVWEWVAGPPFVGSPAEVRHAHLAGVFPRLRPRFAVPHDLESVLVRLLARSPLERPPSAPAAAALFDALAVVSSGSSPPLPAPLADTWDDGEPMPEGPEPRLLVAPAVVPAARIPVGLGPCPASRFARPRLYGMGLGVYELIDPPMVGRDAERQHLWSALLQAAEGRCRVVTVRGPAGSGKSHLARWVTVSAAERGAVGVLATHGAVAGAEDGFDAAIRRCYVPGAKGLSPGLSRRDWLAAAEAWLAGLGRPVVVWLDDVLYSEDALSLAEWLAGRPIPVLAVLTVRDELERALPEAAARVRALDPGGLAIGPLAGEDRRALLAGRVGLDPLVAARIDERTEGNPLFAVQLLADWVRRGILLLGPRGYAPAPDASLALPPDLRALFAARLLGLPESEGLALAVAAALGTTVATAEWREVLAQLGAQLPSIEPWIAAGLVTSGDPAVAFRFAHGLIRESALAEGAARRLIAAATARVLAARGADPERVGRQWLDAGESVEAVDPLYAAAWTRQIRGDLGLADALYADRERALQALPATDARWGLGWVRRAGMYLNQGRWPEAEALLEAALAGGWQTVTAEALSIRAVIRCNQGAFGDAEADARRSVALWRELGGAAGEKRAWITLADVQKEQRLLADAEASARRALALTGPPVVEAEAWRLFGHTLLRQMRLGEARSALRESLRWMTEIGSRSGQGNCWNDLAAIDHLEGHLEDALPAYLAAARELSAIDSHHEALAPRLNVVVVRLLLGEPVNSLIPEIQALDRDIPVDRGHYRVIAELLLAVAAPGDTGPLSRAEALLDASGYVDVDVAALLERIAREDPAVADRCLVRARAQRRAAGVA